MMNKRKAPLVRLEFQRFTQGSAPGKAILFGEHAVNRGQGAIAVALGLHTSCDVAPAASYQFESESQVQRSSREEILALTQRLEQYQVDKNYDAIRTESGEDYFAPQKYILGRWFKDDLPPGLKVTWKSQVPSAAGLGSGAAAFNAMVAALGAALPCSPTLEQRAELAWSGDVIAHGGTASGLDSQTSLLGGVILYEGSELARQIPCAAGLSLILAFSGQHSATRIVNARVRDWLAASPASRLKYFETIGALVRAAEPVLARGEWAELGRLLTLNQLVLEKIGVSSPEIEKVLQIALSAGALGGKVTGSGGGGMVLLLVRADEAGAVTEALDWASIKHMAPAVGVSGAAVTGVL